jgi:hypothetical protein
MALQNSFATFFGADYPATGNVINTAPTYGDAVNVLNGTLTPGAGGVMPSEDDVRFGTAVGTGTGNMTLPAVADVLLGVTFGTNGTEFTGTLVQNVIPTPPAGAMCRLKIQISLNGEPVDDARVTCALCQANSVAGGNIAPSVTGNFVDTVNGYAEIDLYRQSAFTRGDGLYQIQAVHHNQKLCSIKVGMPDQQDIFLSELIALAEPGYTGG